MLGKVISKVARVTSLGGIKELSSAKLDAVFPTVFSQQAHAAAATKTLAAPLAFARTVDTGMELLQRPGEALDVLKDAARDTAKKYAVQQLGAAMDYEFDMGGFGGAALGITKAVLDYKTRRAQAGSLAAPAAMPGAPAMILPAALPSLPALGGMAARGMAALGLGAAGSAVVTGAGVAGRWVVTQFGRISRRKLFVLAKHFGSVAATAAALGISEAMVAQAIVDETARPRRGRGVTAAQLRTTRRTMRVVERMHRQIQGYCRSAGVGRSRSSSMPFRRKRKC